MQERLILGYCLPFSLFFNVVSQGADPGNDAETVKFCRHIICGFTPQVFMLIHMEFSSQHCGALGAAWGVVSMRATRVLLVVTRVYNKVDRL